MAYRSYEASEDYSKEDYTFQSDSKKHGVYYLLDTKTNKWSKKTTGKYTAVNGFSSGFAANVYTYYSNTTGSKLYCSKDGFKTVRKISLKAGSKVIKSNITATYIQKVSKKSVYAYILCGSKMYYTTTSSILNVK